MSEGAGIVRRVRVRDLADIVHIETLSFPDPWDEEMIQQVMEYYPRTFFAAELDGHIAGFLAAGLEDTGEERYGHIMNLAVLPALRCRGFGRNLVARVEAEFILLGASAVQLEVRFSNTAARRFYERLGYRQVLVFAGYYTNGEDAVVMMKWFSF